MQHNNIQNRFNFFTIIVPFFICFFSSELLAQSSTYQCELLKKDFKFYTEKLRQEKINQNQYAKLFVDNHRLYRKTHARQAKESMVKYGRLLIDSHNRWAMYERLLVQARIEFRNQDCQRVLLKRKTDIIAPIPGRVHYRRLKEKHYHPDNKFVPNKLLL